MNSISDFDVVVVGSGPAGTNAAYPLVKAGLKVAIIDGGLDSGKQDRQLNEFFEAKLTKTSHYYDLMEKHSYIFNKTYQLLKLQSNIEIIQTLAKGGLSEFWNGICDFFTSEELKATGLPVNEVQAAYKEVIRRIKLKSQNDLGAHGNLLLHTSKRNILSNNAVYQVAVAYNYKGSNDIEEFKKNKNFTYLPNQVVVTVKEKTNFIEIKSLSIGKERKNAELFSRARYVILAAGSLNTTRILLRSLELFNYKTTFLTKAHYLVACLHPRTIGKRNLGKKLNTGQLVMLSDVADQKVKAVFTHLYEFNPTALSKILKYIPLPKFIALFLLSFISPSIMIADIRFPVFEAKNKWCMLKRESKNNDIFEIFFQESDEEINEQKRNYHKVIKVLGSLGLFPLRTVRDHITSHYAGGVPYQKIPGKLSSDINGKLHQASRIYIADSSTWKALPAKPPTLTIMANASRVGKNVLKNFKRK